jgi:hypothetical protein
MLSSLAFKAGGSKLYRQVMPGLSFEANDWD